MRESAIRPSILFVLIVAVIGVHPAVAETVPAGRSPHQPMQAGSTAPPLTFEENRGQAAPGVRFVTRASGGVIAFTNDQVVAAFPNGETDPVTIPDQPQWPAEVTAPGATAMVGRSLRVAGLEFVGAAESATVTGGAAARERVNYILGDDPRRWRTNVPTHAWISYANLYDGIDLRYDGEDGRLKGTYTVAPAADPASIRWRYPGASKVWLDPGGNLRAHVNGVALTEERPIAWQVFDGHRRGVDVSFSIQKNGDVGFAVGGYDRDTALVIDPAIAYSTYVGGSGDDYGYDVTADASGNAYVVGASLSTNFPTSNPYQAARTGTLHDVVVFKMDPAGAGRLYSTYVGGAENDLGKSVAVDREGHAYIAGTTRSHNFPTTAGAYQRTSAGAGQYDAFVVKLSPEGNALVYSTLVGGTAGDQAEDLFVDDAGNAYLSGGSYSADFPIVNAFQPVKSEGADLIVAKLDPHGSQLLYSTFLGGSGFDFSFGGLAVDESGDAYVTGQTASVDFPGTAAPNAGTSDAFLARLDSSGSALRYSTYLGGTAGDLGIDLALTPDGRIVLAGYTDSLDFPRKGAPQSQHMGGADGFVTTFDADGISVSSSRLLGGTGLDLPDAVAIGGHGEIYIAGTTSSVNFPVLDAVQPRHAGGEYDAFLVSLDPDAVTAQWSTYLGGSGRDFAFGLAHAATDTLVVSGATRSSNFLTQGAHQSSNAGGSDVFVTSLTLASSKLYFHSAATPSNAADTLALGGAAFHPGIPTGPAPALAAWSSGPAPIGEVGEAARWTGRLHGSFDALTLDLWHASNEGTARAVTYRVSLSVAEQTFRLPPITATSPGAAPQRVAHRFTTMLDASGAEIPLAVGPVLGVATITIATDLDGEGAGGILYGSSDYPSGFVIDLEDRS